MQRIINDPNMVVEDMLKGFAKCHRDIIHVDEENPRVIISNSFNKQKKVGIVTGGGSGHKPAFIGYCGEQISEGGGIERSATAENTWQMRSLWGKSFPHRQPRASMTVSVRWIRAWEWQCCMAIMPEII